MKTIFKILLISLFFSLIAMGLISCEKEKKSAFTVSMYNIHLPYTDVCCDSVKMISNTHVQCYKNGLKIDLYAKEITVKSN